MSSAPEMLVLDVLLKVSYHAPELVGLAMTNGGAVDVVINEL